MLIKNRIKQFALVATLASAVVCAQTPYDDAQTALRAQRYAEAAEKFEQAIQADKANADASMYWRAYSLYKEGRERQARDEVGSAHAGPRACKQRKHKKDRWETDDPSGSSRESD